jgi:hypothetical protein
MKIKLKHSISLVKYALKHKFVKINKFKFSFHDFQGNDFMYFFCYFFNQFLVAYIVKQNYLPEKITKQQWEGYSIDEDEQYESH